MTLHVADPADHARLLARWTGPERPGMDAAAGHVLATGHGRVLVDDLAAPQVVIVDVGGAPGAGDAGGAGALADVGDKLVDGDPAVLTGAEVRAALRGFVAGWPAGRAGLPADRTPLERALRGAFGEAPRVDRVVAVLPRGAVLPRAVHPDAVGVRPLGPQDAPGLAALPPDLAWIGKTWGGAEGLARSGHAWGAVRGGDVLAVACAFYVGVRHEEIGVVTVPGHRRRGLATAAAAGLCTDVLARGRVPSWSTTPDNAGSLGAARRLGLREVYRDVAYLAGIGAAGG